MDFDFTDILAGAELVILAMLSYAKPFFRKLLKEVVSEQLDLKLGPLVARVQRLEIVVRDSELEGDIAPRKIARKPTNPIPVDFGAAE